MKNKSRLIKINLSNVLYSSFKHKFYFETQLKNIFIDRKAPRERYG